MAESFREPNAVMLRETSADTVRVTMVCQGIDVCADSGDCNADVRVKFDLRSFEMTARVRMLDRTVNYRRVTKQLPGTIHPERCSYRIQKDKVVIDLIKQPQFSWQRQMMSNGLDQASSDDSD